MKIVHNHDNDHLDRLFHQNILPLRESTSIMSGNGKGFTLEVQSLVDGLLNVFFFFILLFNCIIVYFIYL